MRLANLPLHFYKYRSMADELQIGYVKDILLNNRLYWPSPNQFNDPFDCSPVASFAQGKLKRAGYANRVVGRNMPAASRYQRRETRRRMTKDNLARAEAELPSIFRKRMERVGVCSLSEEHDNILMWSHYADSHRGICLRLSPTPVGPRFILGGSCFLFGRTASTRLD